jgi:hypothetical protein
VGDRLVLFSVEALAVLLSSDEGLLHTEEALIVAEPAIMWRPEFVVRISGSSSIDSLALWLMELREVKVDKESLVTLCWLIVVTLRVLIFGSIFCISSIDHELL